MRIYKSGLSARNFMSSDSGYSKKYLSELCDEYEKLKDSPIRELSSSLFNEYFKSGNRLLYETEYFHRRTMLRDFALKAWLGDNEAISRLEKIMTAVCNERAWALPAHAGDNSPETVIDLFASETAQTLTEIVSLLEGKISSAVAERCIAEVKRRVLEPFINRNEKYNWESMKSNWCAVCGGCVGIIALYLTEDTEFLKQITDSLKDTFDSYMKSFSDDGACLEGLYYWNYGMMYLTAFLDLYRERMGEDFPVNTGKLIRMADFAHKCCITDGITVSFSDSGEHDKVYSGLSCRLSELYGARPVREEYKAYFSGDDCGRWCKAVRDIAWTHDTVADVCERASILPDAQWAVIRGENTAFAFKGGSNGEPHNHNDVGSFIAVKNGEVILCDIGVGEYTRQYFSDERYNIFCTRSLGHSVPVVNGFEQKAGGGCSSKAFFADENSARADISGAYGVEELKKCMRNIVLCENEFTITDTIETTVPLKITERFITRLKAEGTLNGADIIEDGEIIAVLKSGNDCKTVINAYTHRGHDGSISEITAIDFIFEANGKTEFSVKLK